MTSDDARFRYLVESPYGLAAVEIMVQRCRAQVLMSLKGKKIREALFEKFVETLALRDEIAGARARARGMGDG